MRFTWIGGPTFLLEFGAIRILSDPVFSESFQLLGQSVQRNVPVPDVAVPEVDVLALSCARPDHFDEESVARLPGIDTAAFPPSCDNLMEVFPARVRKAMAGDDRMQVRKGEEKLIVTAVPAGEADNGYFFEYSAGGKAFTAYWTGDARFSKRVRDLQQKKGYANLLVMHLGAETGPGGDAITADGKDAMQFVYRMQPNAIAAVHHNTFSHYNETIDPFRELVSRTIYEKRLRALSEGESFEKG